MNINYSLILKLNRAYWAYKGPDSRILETKQIVNCKICKKPLEIIIVAKNSNTSDYILASTVSGSIIYNRNPIESDLYDYTSFIQYLVHEECIDGFRVCPFDF